MTREARLWFSRGMILILAVFFSSASVWSSGKESHMPPLMNSNSHTVNLEVTHLFHALKWVKWKEEDLPPAKKPVKCLIVGKDTFGFCDRLSFVFSESGAGIAGRPIDFVPLGSMNEALELAETDKTVMLLVALETVAEEWEPPLFPKRPGFLVYGQSAKFSKKGVTFFSRSIHNRVKLSVNLRRARSSGLTLSSKLLEYKKIFTVDNGTASGPLEK